MSALRRHDDHSHFGIPLPDAQREINSIEFTRHLYVRTDELKAWIFLQQGQRVCGVTSLDDLETRFLQNVCSMESYQEIIVDDEDCRSCHDGLYDLVFAPRPH